MNCRAFLPCFTVIVITLAGSLGCSTSPTGSETAKSAADAAKAPLKLDKIQGKVQIRLQADPSEAGLNGDGPSVFLWEGARRYRLFFKARTEVNPGQHYVAEGVWAQRVIDEMGDPAGGKNGYPLESSCAHIVRRVWPGQSMDNNDALASSLKNSIKRYPARPVFLVTKITAVEGPTPKEDDTPGIPLPANKEKEARLEGSTTFPAPLWAADGGTAKCKILIGKDGKVAEVQSGAQLCVAVPWETFRYKPPMQAGKSVRFATEVEVKFELKK